MFSVCLPRHCTATLPPLHSVAAIAALFDQRHSYNFVFALLTTNGFRRQRPQVLQGIVVRIHLAAHVRCESCLAQHLHTTTTTADAVYDRNCCKACGSIPPRSPSPAFLLTGCLAQQFAYMFFHCSLARYHLCLLPRSDSYLVFSPCSVMHSACMYQSCNGRQQ